MNPRESQDPLQCRLFGYGVLFVFGFFWVISLVYIGDFV